MPTKIHRVLLPELARDLQGQPPDGTGDQVGLRFEPGFAFWIPRSCSVYTGRRSLIPRVAVTGVCGLSSSGSRFNFRSLTTPNGTNNLPGFCQRSNRPRLDAIGPRHHDLKLGCDKRPVRGGFCEAAAVGWSAREETTSSIPRTPAP